MIGARLALLLTAGVLMGAGGSSTAQAPTVVELGPDTRVIAGAGQGNRGDLVVAHGATIEGAHVIQGGRLECRDRLEGPPCSSSGIRRLSLNLDVGAGSSSHRGVVSVNYDVGRGTFVFDGHTHPGIRVRYQRRHNRPRVDLDGDVYVNGHRLRP